MRSGQHARVSGRCICSARGVSKGHRAQTENRQRDNCGSAEVAYHGAFTSKKKKKKKGKKSSALGFARYIQTFNCAVRVNYALYSQYARVCDCLCMTVDLCP